MLMPGRGYSATGAYRYGFNGQEKSTEIDPNGNSMTAEFWQYDARLGRRWETDPKPSSAISPYNTFSGNPINYTDVLGDTIRPGFSVHAFKFTARNNPLTPSIGLFEFIPENSTGDKIVGFMTGVGQLVTETFEGTRQLITEPKEVFSQLFNPKYVNPFLMTPEDWNGIMKPYMDDIQAYGNDYADAKFWTTAILRPALIVAPSIKGSPRSFYTSEMAAIDYAVLESMLPRRPTFRVVSAMEAEGKITIGTNGAFGGGELNGKLGAASISLEKWSVLQCAEPKALNQILNSGASKSNVTPATFSLRSGKTYRGSAIFSNLEFSSGRIISPKAPCMNCNSLLKGTKGRQ